MAIHTRGRWRLELETRAELRDALALQTAERLRSWLGLAVTRVLTRKVFHLDLDLDRDEAERVLAALVDPIAEHGALGMLPDPWDDAPGILTVGFRPGVTDTVGATVKRAAEDCLGRPLAGHAYSSTMFVIWGLDRAGLERAASELLVNSLIQRARFDALPRTLDLEVPRAGAETAPEIAIVPLREADDAELVRISEAGILALSLIEMRAIAEHFRGLGRDPTDAELECLAQTWSEHCKHKIFAAPIDMREPDGRTVRIDGLFRTYVRGATDAVAEARAQAGLDREGEPLLVSVFHDNAGVVRFSADDHLVYKVETHNSPSALDPYGGAMTGIVGVNRDSFGTGLGADLLTNVWGYCFGDPHHELAMPPGLLHPRRLRDGVHRGVIDGGNQSGIPQSRGFELFDARYLGKPLVFCGTVAVMPVVSAGRPTHRKAASVGDRVVLVGGRTGKDGIHGATFSSVRLDESSPVQAVQIGDPITQKMMFDMLTAARDQGLIASMTDNGAGGLSSSVGEMATATGGAHIDLARVPLKYPGLQPWEILISEAQERMTVAVRPEHEAAFLALAARYEVEATVLGTFDASGRLHVTYGDRTVADLDLEFLHDGVPLPPLRAEARASAPANDDGFARWSAQADAAAMVLAVLSMPEHADGSARRRSYDHEVKGLSVVKPLGGIRRDVPSVATVMRARHGRDEGVVLAEGVHPFYADLDAEQMARACLDEAVRRVLCAGARLDRIAALDNFCWPDPVQSDRTVDGAHKLAQLVQCCRGLYDACVAFGVPLISGKDSMKNDAYIGGVKISIPPTLLVSVMGQMPDVAHALEQRVAPGHDLWLLGETRDELGGSSAARQAGWMHQGQVPHTDLERAVGDARAFVELRELGLVTAASAPARGGLAIALSHLVLAAELAIHVDLDAVAPTLSDLAALASESTGRFLFTARASDRAAVVTRLHGRTAARIGTVGGRDEAAALVVARGDTPRFELGLAALRRGFAAGLAGM